jgi:hypothetical protein
VSTNVEVGEPTTAAGVGLRVVEWNQIVPPHSNNDARKAKNILRLGLLSVGAVVFITLRAVQ